MSARRPVDHDASGDESFAPTSGTFVGWFVIAVAVVVAVLGVLDGTDGFGPAALVAALVASVFAWLTLLRPRVLLQGDAVVLRQSLSTTRIPLAAVEDVSVRHVLEISAGGKRYATAAIGHPRRRIVREAAGAGRREQEGSAPRVGEVHWADHVESRLRRAALDARARGTGQEGAVERRIDVVPAVALGVTLLVVVGAFLR